MKLLKFQDVLVTILNTNRKSVIIEVPSPFVIPVSLKTKCNKIRNVLINYEIKDHRKKQEKNTSCIPYI